MSVLKTCCCLYLFLVLGPAIIYAQHSYDGSYKGANMGQIAFPIGGMGAGMFCLEGTGALSHMSVRHSPDIYNEPTLFAAIMLKGRPGTARVLEGPVPGWKKFGQRGAGKGGEGATYGLARFREAEFEAHFPFGEVGLRDKAFPLEVRITGWSPFIPADEENSSLPVGGVEYHFRNTGDKPQDYVFSYNARSFMSVYQRPGMYDSVVAPNHIDSVQQGFILSQEGTARAPFLKGNYAIFTGAAEKDAVVDYCWFRGGWWDPLSMAWNHIEEGRVKPVSPVEKGAPGASLFIPFKLNPGQTKTVHILMAWYVPDSRLRLGRPMTQSSDSTVRDASTTLPSIYYKPWYSSKFKDIGEVITYWRDHYEELRNKTLLFSHAFYKSTLPPEAKEAIAANLCILKSPTVLRQFDGRFWGWEGSDDDQGSCEGSCTHVWNYAQALCHLFPRLERGMRDTEFGEGQDTNGHQTFRAALPIRPLAHTFYAAADGQLGGIMKIHREWRISGDSVWLRGIYPKVKSSLDYCIRTWDPRRHGVLEEPHHNTYDIEFWGPDPMCTSFYLGALGSMIKIGEYLKEDVTPYKDLYEKGRAFMEHELFNGQYFCQKIQWTGLNAGDPVEASKKSYFGGYSSDESIQLLKKEGPEYQYGKGCLSDGVIGAWIARVCGLPAPLDTQYIGRHLNSVYTYNLKKDLTDFSNPQRPNFAVGREGGLLLCTWPLGGKLSLPFIYSNEVWTGIEYEVASHLIFTGRVQEGLDIVRTCRSRYDGTVRNPFDEYECGHWYARALSSYALLEALTGVRYDAVDQTLYVDSRMGDFTSFLSTATGFGNVIYSHGKATLQIAYGVIPVKKIIIAGK